MERLLEKNDAVKPAARLLTEKGFVVIGTEVLCGNR
jgi:hypothetical protein